MTEPFRAFQALQKLFKGMGHEIHLVKLCRENSLMMGRAKLFWWTVFIAREEDGRLPLAAVSVV